MDLRRVDNVEAAMEPAVKYKALKRSFWKWFMRKMVPYFCVFIIFLILFGVGISFAEWYIQIICILVLLLLICACPMRTCFYFVKSGSKYNETTIKAMDAYQDEKMMTECWEKAMEHGRWSSKHDVCDQVIPGFCGFSTINSLLSASYKQLLFLVYPEKATPISLQQMRDIIDGNVMNDESVKKDHANVCLESVEAIKMNPNEITLADFEKMITEIRESVITTDKDGVQWQEIIYYAGNFSRQPLFFCNLKSFRKRFWFWFVGGHFSPIIDFCYDEKKDMYILVGDTNRDKYGDWMVRSDRLYEAMKCLQLGGDPRGLLKMKIKRKITVDTIEKADETVNAS